MDLFYTPQYAKTGDVIPYYDEETKRFENFYLKNWNSDAPKEQVVYGWHRITTTDNRRYEESPTGIHGGTGSIVKVDGLYHMFYCFRIIPNYSGPDMPPAGICLTGRIFRRTNSERTA